jgi:hypothetical protein
MLRLKISPYTIHKKEESGRFIPVTIIKNSTEHTDIVSRV